MKRPYAIILSVTLFTLLFGVFALHAQDAQPTPLFGGARPEAEVLENADLLSQPRYPGGNTPLLLGQLQAGDKVIVLDVDDLTRSWFRVLYPNPTGTPLFGWTRIDYIDYSTRRANPYAAPPGCTQAVGTASSLNELWDSSVQGKVAVVVDLYRDTRIDPFPQSVFRLTRNGQELLDRERLFRSAGYFLMNGIVISADVRPGNVLGFSTTTTNTEPLNFFGIIYSVPQGCDFGD